MICAYLFPVMVPLLCWRVIINMFFSDVVCFKAETCIPSYLLCYKSIIHDQIIYMVCVKHLNWCKTLVEFKRVSYFDINTSIFYYFKMITALGNNYGRR